MKLESKKYLHVILFAISLIEEFMADIKSFGQYLKDTKTQSAVERQLGIIGEAVNKSDKIDPENSLGNISQIEGLRNRIIHAYESIDATVIWAIMQKYLPVLKEEAKQKIVKQYVIYSGLC